MRDKCEVFFTGLPAGDAQASSLNEVTTVLSAIGLEQLATTAVIGVRPWVQPIYAGTLFRFVQ